MLLLHASPHFCVHSRRMCSQRQLSLISPTSARDSGPLSLSHIRQVSLLTRAVLLCGLSDPALSFSVCTFHASIFKGITFGFYFVFDPQEGSSLIAVRHVGGLKQANVYDIFSILPPILKCHMINRILHSWSFHMKFIKLPEGSFDKFHME